MLELLKEIPALKVEVSGVELLEAMRSVVTEIIKHYNEKEEPEQYVSRKMASEILGVNVSTLHHWNKKNYLCPVKVGSAVRYKKSDLNRILPDRILKTEKI